MTTKTILKSNKDFLKLHPTEKAEYREIEKVVEEVNLLIKKTDVKKLRSADTSDFLIKIDDNLYRNTTCS